MSDERGENRGEIEVWHCGMPLVGNDKLVEADWGSANYKTFL